MNITEQLIELNIVGTQVRIWIAIDDQTDLNKNIEWFTNYVDVVLASDITIRDAAKKIAQQPKVNAVQVGVGRIKVVSYNDWP